MKALLYCTKARPFLRSHFEKPYYRTYDQGSDFGSLNGKIVAECEIETERIEAEIDPLRQTRWYKTGTMTENEILGRSSLYFYELDKYLKGKDGYAIHIKNLRIFDKARELNELEVKTTDFSKRSRTLVTGYDETHKKFKAINITYLEKAPQNMCLVFDGNERKILISIRPEWICKILNGEKTFEVRSQVLNCMKGDML